jgi:hypothetical protein
MFGTTYFFWFFFSKDEKCEKRAEEMTSSLAHLFRSGDIKPGEEFNRERATS